MFGGTSMNSSTSQSVMANGDNSITLKSPTKKFKITVDDTGIPSFTDTGDAANKFTPVTPSELAEKQDALTDADKQSITKTGMTSGAAWTTDEQKAARERMGVDKEYVLIEETVLTEDVIVFERSSEPDGTPYNLSALKVIVKFIPGQEPGSFFLFGQNAQGRNIVGGSTFKLAMPSTTGNASYRSTVAVNILPMSGVYYCVAMAGSQGSAMQVTSSSNGDFQTTSTEEKIKSFFFHMYVSNRIPIIAGTEIQIYGVRA